MPSLKETLTGTRIARYIGAHHGMSARLAEKAGFDGIWASGLEISAAAAVPDAGILTMSQLLEAAKEMRMASTLPILADCDTGFGNATHVMHTVREYEHAGIDGICIEDKVFPKTNSFIAHGQELAPIPEFVGKIQAGKKAQKGADFVLVARIEALIAGLGMDEALERARAYAGAGADAILIHSKKKTSDEIIKFLEAWQGRSPVVIVPTTYPDIDLGRAQSLGVRLVIYANQGLRASLAAIEDTYRTIVRDGHTLNVESRIANLDRVFEVQGMNAHKDMEVRYEAQNFTPPALILSAGARTWDDSLSPLLADKPLCMLDCAGTPLLEVQRRMFSDAGIGQVHAALGDRAPKVITKGVTLHVNAEFASTGSAQTSLCAGLEGPLLVMYGDVIVNEEHVRRLLESRHDVTVLLDGSTQPRYAGGGKKMEIAHTDAPTKDRRDLHLTRLVRVTAMGKHLPSSDGACEFAGLALFSRQGWERYRKLLSAHPQGRTHSFCQALQAMIESGEEVGGLVVSRGWSEIHTLEDHQRLVGRLAAKA